MNIKETVSELSQLSHAERADYIAEYLSIHNIPNDNHPFDQGNNISVVRQGTDLQKEIIFFAHYDISNQTKEGANDNTSSVAVLLQVAEYLNSITPDLTVRLIFNDTEEILGALLLENSKMGNIMEIITRVGSFNYLKHHVNKQDVQGVFVLELSGIGDALFFGEKSGNVPCDKRLLSILNELSGEQKIPNITIPVFSSDMISVFTERMPGVVLGAIPYYEAKSYQDALKAFSKEPPIPHVWKKIHTFGDTVFSIQEKSLEMVYRFICSVIDNSVRFLVE